MNVKKVNNAFQESWNLLKYRLDKNKLSHSIFIAGFPKSGSTYLSRILLDLSGYKDVHLAYNCGRNDQDIYRPYLIKHHSISTFTAHHTRGTDSNIQLLNQFHLKPILNVRNIFDQYKQLSLKTKSEPILLLNEADQFLSSRVSSSMNGSEKMYNQMQNIFLEQIEKFDGILIATTNLIENLDKAFSRRFNYKIEFTKPNIEERKNLWNKLLPSNIPIKKAFDINKLSSYSLTGGQIELIIKNTAFQIAIKDEPIFTTQDFIYQIDKEVKSMFDKDKIMGFVN